MQISHPTQNIACLMKMTQDGSIVDERCILQDALEGKGVTDFYYSYLQNLKCDVLFITNNSKVGPAVTLKSANNSITEAVPFLGFRHCPACTAVLDPKGLVSYNSNVFNDTTLIVVVGSKTCPKEYLDYLKDKEISYTFAGEDGCDLRSALKSLYADFGLRKSLLVGDSILNASFFNKRLVDELYVMVNLGADKKNMESSIIEDNMYRNNLPLLGQKFELLGIKKIMPSMSMFHYKIRFYEIEDNTSTVRHNF